jgi:hypothetical protein
MMLSRTYQRRPPQEFQLLAKHLMPIGLGIIVLKAKLSRRRLLLHIENRNSLHGVLCGSALDRNEKPSFGECNAELEHVLLRNLNQRSPFIFAGHTRCARARGITILHWILAHLDSSVLCYCCCGDNQLITRIKCCPLTSHLPMSNFSVPNQLIIQPQSANMGSESFGLVVSINPELVQQHLHPIVTKTSICRMVSVCYHNNTNTATSHPHLAGNTSVPVCRYAQYSSPPGPQHKLFIMTNPKTEPAGPFAPNISSTPSSGILSGQQGRMNIDNAVLTHRRTIHISQAQRNQHPQRGQRINC